MAVEREVLKHLIQEIFVNVMEDISSTDSDSESEDDVVMETLTKPPGQKRSARRPKSVVLGVDDPEPPPKRTKAEENGFVENVVPSLSDIDFQSQFRVTRSTFENVLNIVAPGLRRHVSGNHMLAPDKQLLIALCRMTTSDSYRLICQKFGCSQSTALSSMRRVTRCLVGLAESAIRWPLDERAQAVFTGFEAFSGFKNVIGAIDVKYINLPAQKRDPAADVPDSIQLQAVCDHKARFTHVYISVGNSQDQGVFRMSEVQRFLGDPDKFPENSHLVGDTAYRLHVNMMTPYPDNGRLTPLQNNYNFWHASAHIAIEKAFSMLTARFSSLLTVLAMTDVAEIPNVIMACCVLHNLCSFCDDEIEVEDGAHSDFLTDSPHESSFTDSVAGVAKRNMIALSLPQKLE